MLGWAVLWMAMVGQGQTHTCSKGAMWSEAYQMCIPLTDPGIVEPGRTVTPNNIDKLCKQADNGNIECPTPKPREHVIEIRTKRETRKPETVKPYSGPEPQYPFVYEDCPEGWHMAYDDHCDEHSNVCTSIYVAPQCERVTKTLWIDGKRIGVIREVEDK